MTDELRYTPAMDSVVKLEARFDSLSLRRLAELIGESVDDEVGATVNLKDQSPEDGIALAIDADPDEVDDIHDAIQAALEDASIQPKWQVTARVGDVEKTYELSDDEDERSPEARKAAHERMRAYWESRKKSVSTEEEAAVDDTAETRPVKTRSGAKWSPEAREAARERMRAYWAARKNTNARKDPADDEEDE